MAAAPELRQFTVDLSAMRPGTISFGDLIDVSEATGVDVTELERLMVAGNGTERLKVLCGFAWLEARRADPELTYQDVLRGQVKVTGQRDRTRPAKTRGKAG